MKQKTEYSYVHTAVAVEVAFCEASTGTCCEV